jgi:predicted outer membrane repeat protein
MNYPLKERLTYRQRSGAAETLGNIGVAKRTLLVLMVLFAFGLTPTPRAEGAATITVCASGCNYTTIQDAIDHAASGRTISIQEALHTEANIAVSKNLTIEGQGAANTAVDGGAAGSVFIISSGVTATLRDLTIQNGKASYGAGVYNNGNLTVVDCVIQDNTATNRGGGIYNESYATLTATNSAFSGNAATYWGGGIFNSSHSTVTATNSTFSGNTAASYGGGIYDGGASLTTTNSTFSSNSAFGGGGIFSSQSAALTATNCTFSDNSADFEGGAIDLFFHSAVTATNCTFSDNTAGTTGTGGGINNFEGTLTATNSSFSDNSAGSGGGIYNFNSRLTATNCTFSDNTANQGGGISNHFRTGAFVKSSILASQPGGNCYNDSGTNGSSTYDRDYNISDDTSCGFAETDSAGNGDNVSPLLDTAGLQDNGGPTETIALQAGSPAIDAIPVADCTDQDEPIRYPVATDQRGYARPDEGESSCDIGAYESGAIGSGKLEIHISSGSFDLKSGIVLAGAIDPLTQDVTLQVGSYSVTIPAGYFAEGGKKHAYVFEGTIGGVSLQVRILPLADGSYSLQAQGSGASLSGITNPVTVTLSVGTISGSNSVVASIR